MTSMTPTTVTATTTDSLEADGVVSGYAKAWAAFLSLLLSTALPWIVDQQWAKWAALAIALLGIVAVYGLPNRFKPITIAVPPTPAGNIDVDDTPGRHAADQL